MRNIERLERRCATHLRLTEAEEPVPVADRRALPDLLTETVVLARRVYRVREVKFRLETRLVAKALRQLDRGLDWIESRFPEAEVDRVELVVPLDGRALKPAELPFLGAPAGPHRYALVLDGKPGVVARGDRNYPVTVLLV